MGAIIAFQSLVLGAEADLFGDLSAGGWMLGYCILAFNLYNCLGFHCKETCPFRSCFCITIAVLIQHHRSGPLHPANQ